MKKKDGIENWSMFGAKSVHMEVHKFTVDDKVFYSPHLTFILDSYSNSDEEQKAITIVTDGYYEDVKEAIYETAQSVAGLFENFSAEVVVLNEEFDEEATYNLNEDFDEFGEEFDEDDIEIIEKPVLH